MSLRVKLLAGYLVFIAALVVLGAWSAWRLHDMGKVSRRIISENYDSVVAAQEMKESLERQDSAALFALLGAREKALVQLREHRRFGKITGRDGCPGPNFRRDNGTAAINSNDNDERFHHRRR